MGGRTRGVGTWATEESAGRAGALAESEGSERGGEAAEDIQAKVAPPSPGNMTANGSTFQVAIGHLRGIDYISRIQQLVAQ